MTILRTGRNLKSPVLPFGVKIREITMILFKDSSDKEEEIDSIKTKMNGLLKDNNLKSNHLRRKKKVDMRFFDQFNLIYYFIIGEQLNHLNKQVQSLEAIKNELNSHVAVLNDELSKSKAFSSKFVNIEQEKRKLMEENSGIYF